MKTWKKTAAAGALALVATTGLAACGEAPADKEAKGNDFLPCVLSDSGGFNDKSFNQLSYEGVVQAADELDSEFKEFQSKSENDYDPALESFISAGCDVIVTVGFALSASTLKFAEQNPDVNFILIDDPADADQDGKADQPNIKPLMYDTAQAAFLAGYAAADYTTTGVVGTYGGQPFPSVTIFMDGYKQGVDYYNKEKSKDVKLVGFSGGDKGVFTGGFNADEKATNAARQLIAQDADVVLPVGGPIYIGALTAIADTKGDVALIGTDADLFVTDPETKDVVFTSILKKMKESTYEAVMAAGNDEFDPALYVGTLENGGVEIAPFHNFEDKISDTLVAELDALREGIKSGEIKVDSYLN